MQWNYRYFKPEEFTHPQRMNFEFMHRLDRWRQWLATRILVLQSNETKEEELARYGKLEHSENSNHYLNYAADVILPDSKLCLFDQWLSATRFFNGIGMYPEWKHQNFPGIKGGLHVEFVPGQMRARHWIQSGGQYIGVTRKNLIDLELT